jgi:hypothetical protein
MTPESNTAEDTVTALEVKAIEWIERADAERDPSRGFVGELVMCLVAECRAEGDDAEAMLATIGSTLDSFAEAASTFTAGDVACEIADA